MSTIVIHPRISAENYKELKVITEQRQVPMGAVVEAALTKYLRPGPDADKDLLLRRFDKLNQKIGVLDVDLKIIWEMLALFIYAYLSNTPEVPTSQKKAALALGDRRYQQFMDEIIKKLSSTEGGLAATLDKLLDTRNDPKTT